MLLASGFSEEDVAVQQAFGAYPVGAKDSDGSEVLRPEAKGATVGWPGIGLAALSCC